MSPNSPPPGLVRSLFQGRLEAASFLPFPSPPAEVRETTDEIVGMIAAWAADAIDPEAIDRDKAIPESVVDGLRELGLFGLTIPEEYGGAGMGQYTYARVMETVAHRCASTVTVLGAHLGIGMKGLLLFGKPEQKERFLPSLATGEHLAAFALTEAGAGSDAAALRTRAERDADGDFVLNGRKIWITNAGPASFYTVFARLADPAAPEAPLMERPISAFCVLRGPGVEPGAPEDKMGLRGSNTVELGFEDARVPAGNLLGPEGGGFKVALEILNAGRHGLAASCIGQARLARDLALAHARERRQFGRPIGEHGMVAEMLAGMEADLYAMEAGTWLTAGRIDQGGHDTMLEAACCKTFATEALWRIANDALQVTGGTGFMREYPYERIVRDARINLIFEGTNQVLRMMLATQGLRPLARGEAVAGAVEALAGVPDALDEERRLLTDAVPLFAASAATAAERHGKGVRDAQHVLKRLADMAIALFGQAACLSRAGAALAAGSPDAERETALARLACRRLAGAFRLARDEESHPTDDLVDDVARLMS